MSIPFQPTIVRRLYALLLADIATPIDFSSNVADQVDPELISRTLATQALKDIERISDRPLISRVVESYLLLSSSLAVATLQNGDGKYSPSLVRRNFEQNVPGELKSLVTDSLSEHSDNPELELFAKHWIGDFAYRVSPYLQAPRVIPIIPFAIEMDWATQLSEVQSLIDTQVRTAGREKRALALNAAAEAMFTIAVHWKHRRLSINDSLRLMDLS